jgi:hypothetical protein
MWAMNDQSRAHEPRGATFPSSARSSELAAELLDVMNESELENFVGQLVAEAARDAGRPLPANEHRALVAELRSAAARTLPTLELEGMSPEDRDFEIARQFVRFSQARAAAGAARP